MKPLLALIAFIIGAIEFRRAFCTRYDDWSLTCAYDRGREYAHILTLRRFEA
jgi:hypothetical protein